MSSISVDYGQLSMAGELLERQADHVKNVRGHVDQYCKIPSSGFGGLLQILHPINELVVYTADQGLRQLESLASWSAGNIASTLDAYVESDRAANEDARALMNHLGTSLPPFSDPRGTLPHLGSPSVSAEPDYGQEHHHWHPSIDSRARGAEVADSAGNLVTDTATTAFNRGATLTSRGGVVERTDPSSYLVPPDMRETFAEDLRWKAGVILGGVDWVAEQFLGVSILEEYVLKPFGGDWEAMGAASQAWAHTDRALMEMGSNFTGLPGQIDTWTGIGSVAFLGAMTGTGGACVGVSYAFGAAGSLMSKVAMVAKLACSVIATILKKISYKLTRIAVEAAIPVAGWIVAAAEIVVAIADAIALVGTIKSLIDGIIDAIADFVWAKEKIVQAVFMVEDLVNAAASKAVRV